MHDQEAVEVVAAAAAKTAIVSISVSWNYCSRIGIISSFLVAINSQAQSGSSEHTKGILMLAAAALVAGVLIAAIAARNVR